MATWADVKELYLAAWRFAQACPWLFLLPAVPELLQHIVEIRLGMYDGWASAHAAAASPVRLGFGYAKALALLLPSYWFVRYLAWGDARVGPLRSVRIMAGSFWRTIGYLFAGALPLMAAHYALGLGAIGRPAWLYWPMMLVDAGAVALLALTVAGSGYVAVRHAARRHGVELARETGAAPWGGGSAFAKN